MAFLLLYNFEDSEKLAEWVRDASRIGLGPAEISALSVLREIVESSPSDSKRILGMGINERGMNGADEAVRRRLEAINAGVRSPNVRTLGELPGITLRAKKSGKWEVGGLF